MSISFQDSPFALGLDNSRLRTEAPSEPSPLPLRRRKPWPWASIFLGAVGSLLLLSLMIWVQQTILALLGRSDWAGSLATVLFIVAGIALAMMAVREIAGLLCLSAMTSLRRRAEAALRAEDPRRARSTASRIRGSCKGRQELAEGIARLKKQQRSLRDAKQILALTERELLVPLDRFARATVGLSARRVTVVTSLSPAAMVTVAFVTYENFRMLRYLATVYGGRPSFFAILRLLRVIAGHLAITGGIAFTDSLLHQVLGQGLTARVSRRLGEGLINGCFTIRIGIAAVEVLRPLPYIEAKQPRLREFAAEFLKFGQRQGEMR